MSEACVRCHGHDRQGNPRDGTVVGHVCSKLSDGTLLKMAACWFCIEEARDEMKRCKGKELGKMSIKWLTSSALL